ncbi:MAG: Nramp family divalent metal transporter [Candidatus Saccharimonas sp.]
MNRLMQQSMRVSAATRHGARRILMLLGPAFVAAVAYVDPGNFAANFGAGAKYGYLLLWVLIAANGMAAIAQYLSAKVGIVTGKSLPEIIATRLPLWGRRAYWLQAEMVAIATDIAEVVGGAVALSLLFNWPLVYGGIVIGAVSMLLLLLYNRQGQVIFERVIVALLLLIPIGFFVGLMQHPLQIHGIANGLIPRFAGNETIMLAAAMVGATIMPHVVYLHSAIARDRHGRVAKSQLKKYITATKIDVLLAMTIAGAVNISMLLLAASALHGQSVDTFSDIFKQLSQVLGPLVGILFAVGLLISGLASTAVGSQAGSVIMQDLLHIPVPLWVRRLVTLLPAIALLVAGFDPMMLLVVSQVALSFGVPLALLPLAYVSSSRSIMGSAVNTRVIAWVMYGITAVVTVLNIVLIFTTIFHQ